MLTRPAIIPASIRAGEIAWNRNMIAKARTAPERRQSAKAQPALIAARAEPTQMRRQRPPRRPVSGARPPDALFP